MMCQNKVVLLALRRLFRIETGRKISIGLKLNEQKKYNINQISITWRASDEGGRWKEK